MNEHGEVLHVTYTDGGHDRFGEATRMDVNPEAGLAVIVGDERKLATLVLANVRKWEWVAK